MRSFCPFLIRILLMHEHTIDYNNVFKNFINNKIWKPVDFALPYWFVKVGIRQGILI